MDTHIMIKLVVVLISLSAALKTAVSRESNNLLRWCSQTPHPEPCMYHLAGGQREDKRHHSRLDFRLMLVQSAMNQAVSARVQVAAFGPKCEHPRTRAAWSDCRRLYEDTVLQINRTVQALARPGEAGTLNTGLDVQTWLSTALTDIKTCRLGCTDLSISDLAVSIAPNTNLSQMIRNSLAVNAVIMGSQNRTGGAKTFIGSYPSWLRRPDRRILAGRPRADLVVAGDGSGDFRTVQEAIDEAARREDKSRRFVIHVKRGGYKENILVGSGNDNVMLMGDGMKNTIVTGDRSVKDGFTTFSSATAAIEGPNFIARDITFRNAAGPSKAQAVALRSSSDLSVFYRCAFLGYQDTLMVQSQRQFYRDCYIFGTVDFIFGNAAAVFQNCVILARRPLPGQSNVVTAQSREDPFQNSGITLHACKILPAKDLQPVVGSVRTYLGRPWMPYSRTVVMKSYIGDLVSPQGWMPWIPGSSHGLDTLYYGEYQNYGPGATTEERVKWKGFHVLDSEDAAKNFTVKALIGGESWLQGTGVPFTPGL